MKKGEIRDDFSGSFLFTDSTLFTIYLLIYHSACNEQQFEHVELRTSLDRQINNHIPKKKA